MARPAFPKCALCGKSLVGRSQLARYCSDAHRVEASRRRRVGRISAVVASIPDGDLTRRGRLERLRDQLNASVNMAGPRELPGLARELRQTLAELDSLPAEGGLTVRDDILEARARRRAATGASARSAAGQ